MKEKLQKLIEKYQKYEDKEFCLDENDNIYDIAGGNFDDAYQIGHTHGRNEAVQELLEQLKEIVN